MGLKDGHWTYVFKLSDFPIAKTYSDFTNIIKQQNNRQFPTNESNTLSNVFITQFRNLWNGNRATFRKQNKELVETLADVQSTSAQIVLMSKLRNFEAQFEFFKSKTESDKIYKQDFDDLRIAFMKFVDSPEYSKNLKLLRNRPKPRKTTKKKKT